MGDVDVLERLQELLQESRTLLGELERATEALGSWASLVDSAGRVCGRLQRVVEMYREVVAHGGADE